MPLVALAEEQTAMAARDRDKTLRLEVDLEPEYAAT